MSLDSPDTTFEVVINDQQQYAIWPAYKAVPAGWQKVGVIGDRAHCLVHIGEAWTDMRPRSLREAMQG